MNLNLFTKTLLALTLFFSLSACSSDDDSDDIIQEQESECSELNTQAIVNGDDTYTLVIGQRQTNQGFDGTINQIILSAINQDCNTVKSLQFVVELSGELGGVYDIVDFFDAGLDDAHGSFIIQDSESMSQDVSQIESGIIEVIDNGDSYTFDFEGVLSNGENASFYTTHTF